MLVHQKSLYLEQTQRGFYEVTAEISSFVHECGVETGMVNLFLKHTSASLMINENADPSVLTDLDNYMRELAEGRDYFTHTYEGDDDMPSHIKSALLGVTLTVPVTKGRLNLGTWQGIYLCEHRDHASQREIVMTVYG